MKKKETTKPENQRNFVHKHMMQFQRAVKHRDKKKDYRRKVKHKGRQFDDMFNIFLTSSWC